MTFFFLKIFFNDDALKQAIRNDQLEIIYHLLMNKEGIENEFFENCDDLKAIVLPPTIRYIGYNSFSLKEISIPSRITSISESMFSECISLKKVSFNSRIISIGNFAFSLCNSLKKIFIPSSVTTIGEKSFYQCKSLKHITIPSSVNLIKRACF